ncbi:hypothetical protein HMPREF3144_01230 [Oligella sp. HMSC05A10]|uniref:AMP-binding protein n=1 Tax=Oligella sp. HMSC05A10 TaxID=1581112 RepID=UPI0008A57D00|nr:AMP-binding protein [Oligella sp. HMSC05A10]OFS89046.1 hypothetical protein HMPREF3144_01230 [Oligella sp. HMSC05A10]
MSLPLNAMQQAYLMGRTSGFPLGSVDMQDIRSFYLPASAAQVADAMLEVFAVYPMLSSRVSQDGLFLLQKEDLDYQDNFIISQGSLSQQQSMWQIAEQQIERFISATFDIHKRLWRVALHEFTDDESCVVTFAFNGLLLDGYVISRLIKEVFKLALGGDFTPSLTGVSKGIESNEEPIDEGYGQDYFKAVRQVIQLPWASDLEEIMWTKRKRFSMTLERDLFEQVSNNLLKQGVFANSGYMFAVLKALSAFVGEQHVFAISVPTADSAIKKSFSTNSSFLPIVYDDSRSTSWLEQLIHLQRLVLGLLSTNRLGVIAAQRLSKQLRTILPLPVAFTNGLLWDAHESSEGLVYLGGVTETPQLALDIRLSHLNDKRVLLDLDYAEAALAEDDVIAIAKQVVTNLEKLATLDVLADVKQVIMPSERTAAVNKLSSSMGFIQSIYDKLYAQPSEDVALISQDRRINYKQLALFVASATKVLKQHDMNSGDVLAMILPKCFEQAYYLLGSLFSGVIWLSLDKEAPVERLSYQLRNAQVKGLVCDLVEMGDLVSEIRSTIRLIDVNELYEVTDALVPPALTPNTGQALSCYLYTSGSTGLPKCVALNNQGIDNTLKQTIKKWHLTKVDCFFAATPFHHDMSLFDLLVSFTVGATLVVPEKAQHKDPFLWARLVQEAGVTVWVSVPAIVDMLLLAAEPEKLRSLRVLAQGGDYIREKTIRQLLSANPQLILYSLGGPTETTIWSIWHKIDVDKDMAAYHAIPYGVSLAGNQYYILDAQDNERAVGELGKIAMSGINLSNGYVVDGQLRFDDYKELVLNGKSQRVYVSRDMGRLTTDGLILFEGREEGYFKIRGVRISSQEIENAVLKIEGIDQCVAVELQNEQLSYAELGLAYTVKNKESTSYSSSQLMDALNVFLPDSHIPTQWLLLDAMPLTANGKIDRKSIQELVKLSAYPENDLTRTNAVQLNQDPADISSGGDFSLLLDEAFYKAFLNEMQSEVVETKENSGGIIKTDVNYPATLLQESYLWEADLGKNTIFNLPFVFRVNRDVEPDLLRSVFVSIIERHTALRTLIVVSEGRKSFYQRILPITSLEDQEWFHSITLKDKNSAIGLAYNASTFCFDLTRNIPIRVTQCRLKDSNYLSVLIYHLAFDIWSADVFMNEFVVGLTERLQYMDCINKTEKNSSVLQYVDYALEESRRKQTILRDGLSFWRKRLGSLTEEKGLVACFKQNEPKLGASHKVKEIYHPLRMIFSSQYKKNLNAAGVRLKTSLFQIVYALVVFALHSLGAGKEVLVATSMACRDDPKYQYTIGLFTNVVLTRVNIQRDETLEVFLLNLQKRLFEMGDFNKTPYPYVIRELSAESGSNVLEYYIQVHHMSVFSVEKSLGTDSLKIELLEQKVMPSKFGLHFEVFDESQDDSLVFLIHYDDSKYSATSLQPLVESLKDLISRVGNISSETTVGDFLDGSGKENLYGL